MKLLGGRPSFRNWVDKQTDPKWGLMPLTHITKGIGAEDVIQAGQVKPVDCSVFGQPLAYFFYGRPAYRISAEGSLKVEGACPFCFIFKPMLIEKAASIFAFDTGAYSARMYKHVVLDEMDAEDFSLETEPQRPNKLISTVFGSKAVYFDGDVSQAAAPEDVTEPWDFHARTYIQLLTSTGRNEPDDRIGSIEVIFSEPVPLKGNLLAVIVPHTLWGDDKRAPWLDELHSDGVKIVPYVFFPGRHPDYYYAHMEAAVRDLYGDWSAL